jgi:hypothetical protein
MKALRRYEDFHVLADMSQGYAYFITSHARLFEADHRNRLIVTRQQVTIDFHRNMVGRLDAKLSVAAGPNCHYNYLAHQVQVPMKSACAQAAV